METLNKKKKTKLGLWVLGLFIAILLVFSIDLIHSVHFTEHWEMSKIRKESLMLKLNKKSLDENYIRIDSSNNIDEVSWTMSGKIPEWNLDVVMQKSMTKSDFAPKYTITVNKDTVSSKYFNEVLVLVSMEMILSMGNKRLVLWESDNSLFDRTNLLEEGYKGKIQYKNKSRKVEFEISTHYTDGNFVLSMDQIGRSPSLILGH